MSDQEYSLKELATEYDYLSEKQDTVYAEEINAAIDALREKAPEEWAAYLYWTNAKEMYVKMTEKTKEKIKPRIVDMVKELGESYKSRIHTWIYVKGREQWKHDIVRGFLIAHKQDVGQFMETGDPSVRCTRNKKDIEAE